MPNKSPCHSCERAALDKKECAEKCDRLAAYLGGEPWEGIETPEEFRVEPGDLTQKSETSSGADPKPDETENTCEIPGCEYKIRARGVCSSHYEQWRQGKLPGYPSFKDDLQAHKPRRKVSPKKKTKKREVKFVETRATLLDSQVVVDLSFYPKLRDCIFATAEKFMVPPAHIMISLAGEALAAKRNNG